MKKKIIIIFSFMVFLYFAVVAKAFYIQVINKDKLIAYSESQTVRKIKVYPKRGHILDRNGTPLAINIRQYNLCTFITDKKKLR
jgi:cell division protein FtsI/penicillin-binding protein 2